MTFVITPEKKEHIKSLAKTLREIDACIAPFQEQRKDLKEHYQSNNWLTAEEFMMVRKAYNAAKRNDNLQELQEFMDIVKVELP